MVELPRLSSFLEAHGMRSLVDLFPEYCSWGSCQDLRRVASPVDELVIFEDLAVPFVGICNDLTSTSFQHHDWRFQGKSTLVKPVETP